MTTLYVSGPWLAHRADCTRHGEPARKKGPHGSPCGVAQLEACQQVAAAHTAQIADRPARLVRVESDAETLLLTERDQLTNCLQRYCQQRRGNRFDVRR
jgi:hypothetical protein